MLIMGQFYPWFKNFVFLHFRLICWFSHDITKIQTKDYRIF